MTSFSRETAAADRPIRSEVHSGVGATEEAERDHKAQFSRYLGVPSDWILALPTGRNLNVPGSVSAGLLRKQFTVATDSGRGRDLVRCRKRPHGLRLGDWKKLVETVSPSAAPDCPPQP